MHHINRCSISCPQVFYKLSRAPLLSRTPLLSHVPLFFTRPSSTYATSLLSNIETNFSNCYSTGSFLSPSRVLQVVAKSYFRRAIGVSEPLTFSPSSTKISASRGNITSIREPNLMNPHFWFCITSLPSSTYETMRRAR